jgi:hypothetical protein
MQLKPFDYRYPKTHDLSAAICQKMEKIYSIVFKMPYWRTPYVQNKGKNVELGM